MNTIINTVKELSNNYTWLKHCVREIDVTIIGRQHSLIDALDTDKNKLEPIPKCENVKKTSLKSQVDFAEKKRDEQTDKNYPSRDIGNMI